jgi:hypothetical protein
MRGFWIGALILTAAPTWAGCGGGPFEPIDPEDVTMTLSVSGGFAGMSHSFVVDGAALEIRGESCLARPWCDWDEGELLLPVSGAQVSDLAGRLERAGVLGRSGDYGSECCDQTYFDLTYRRGGREVRIQGTSSRMPADLAEAISHLSTLADRWLPMLVAPETTEADWPQDPYTLGTVTAEGVTLTAELTWGGGCGLHRVDLVTWGGWLETNPVSVNALLTHDDGDDMCDALVTEQRAFDLTSLARAHREVYGPSEGPIRIILRLRDPAATEVRLIELVM